MRLDDVPVPDGAEERAWNVVAQAFDDRVPSPRPRRSRRPLAAVAAVVATAAVVAVASAQPHVVRSVREALGLKGAEAHLSRLPARGRLLVQTPATSWTVAADGATRRLGRAREVTWSPHGLFEAVSTGGELRALDPKGAVRWSLARPTVHDVRWSGDGYRIAYLSGRDLHVVAGDGTGDTTLARGVADVAPSWDGVSHHLAWADAAGRIHLTDTDTRRTLWLSRPALARARGRIAFTLGGWQLVVLQPRALHVLHATTGKLFKTIPLAPGPHALAVSPLGPAAVTTTANGQSRVLLVHPAHPWIRPRQIFRGAGQFSDLTWSPDGHWIALSWPSADQWVFVRLVIHSWAVDRVRAVAGISAHFETRGPTAFGGWCCGADDASRR